MSWWGGGGEGDSRDARSSFFPLLFAGPHDQTGTGKESKYARRIVGPFHTQVQEEQHQQTPEAAQDPPKGRLHSLPSHTAGEQGTTYLFLSRKMIESNRITALLMSAHVSGGQGNRNGRIFLEERGKEDEKTIGKKGVINQSINQWCVFLLFFTLWKKILRRDFLSSVYIPHFTAEGGLFYASATSVTTVVVLGRWPRILAVLSKDAWFMGHHSFIRAGPRWSALVRARFPPPLTVSVIHGK